jgi:type IV secretion system protein VirB3
MEGFRDPIFKGCTRPAMFAGVPLVPMFLVTGVFMMLGMWMFYLVSPYVSLLLLMAYIPVLITMKQITKKDDQRLRQMMMRFSMRFRHQAGRAIWGAVSYSPIRYKKRIK